MNSPRLYFFKDRSFIRLLQAERDFLAQMMRRRKVRSKEILDNIVLGRYS